MTALTSLVGALDHALAPDVASGLAKGVRTFERQEPLEAGHLPGALEIALRARDTDLAESVLGRDALWSDAAQVETVGRRWGLLPSTGQDRLEQELAALVPADPMVIARLLRDLPEPRALQILNSELIEAAIDGAYDDNAAELPTLIEGLLDAPLRQDLRRATQLDRTLELLRPAHAETRDLLTARRDEVARSLAIAERNLWVLRMWLVSPIEDWADWGVLLQPPAPEGSRPTAAHAPHLAEAATAQADAVLQRMFREWSSIPSELEPSIASRVRELLPFMTHAGNDGVGFLGELETALASRWGSSADDVQSRENLHRAALETRLIGAEVAEAVERLVAHDLATELEQTPDAAVLAAVERVATDLALDPLLDVAEHLDRYDPSTEPEEATLELTARAGLALELKRRGEPEWHGPLTTIAYNEELRHVRLRRDAQVLVTRWLHLEPKPTAVRAALGSYQDPVASDLKQAVRDWGEPRSKKDRTLVAKALLQGDRPNSQLISPLTSGEVTQT
jgi:hypothetical protein